MVKRVLFTGARAPVTLDLARQFHRQGIQVFLAESLKHHLSQGSLAVAGQFQVPAPRQETEAFAERLARIIAENQIDLVIPTCEETLYVALLRDRLPCPVLVDRLDKLLKLHDKASFIETCARHGFATPATRMVRSREAMLDAVARNPEVVCKPVYSRFGNEAILCAIGPEEGERLESVECSPERPWVIQEYLSGEHFCSYSVASGGKLVAHSSYSGRYFAGKAVIDFNLRRDAEIEAWVAKLVAAENLTGQVSFDFIRTTDGRLCAIECNPRATSGVHLFAEGDGLVQAMIRAAGLAPAAAASAPTLCRPSGDRKSMLGLAMLIYALPSARSLGELARILKVFAAHRDVILDWRDPVPFFSQFISFGYLALMSWIRGMPVISASTHDIEWNGEAR